MPFQNDKLDFYEKCFETDVTMLKMCKSLLFVLATELKWSREMNYQEICNFCKSHEKYWDLTDNLSKKISFWKNYQKENKYLF